MKRYYTLIVKFESKNAPWEIAFGDYNRAVVEQERIDSYTKQFHDVQDWRIITSGDTQKEVLDACARFNKDFYKQFCEGMLK